MKRDAKFYWTLFRSTFSLSAFTVGGGFVIVPLMKKRFVDDLAQTSDPTEALTILLDRQPDLVVTDIKMP